MFKVKLKEDRVTGLLKRLSRAMTDLSEPMFDIGEFMVESTKQNFINGAAPDGTPWGPKSPTTIAAYKARGDRVDFRPLFGPSGRLSSEIFSLPTEDSVEWGSGMIYAGTMQFGAAKSAFGKTSKGGAIPWGGIPARPFLGISDDDRTGIIETVEEWLQSVASAKD